PQTVEQYSAYLDDFIEDNLAYFYPPNDDRVKEIARRAADQAQTVTTKLQLSPDLTPGLAKLALYDFVILCDNSSSMEQENRMLALGETLKRVAAFATILSDYGISVRFLNYDEDCNGEFDNLTKLRDIEKKLGRVPCGGDTRLGTVLKDKILKPMVLSKARRDMLKKPIIVVIITDGEPFGEPRDKLREIIRDCKIRMDLRGYKKSAVIFLISRVGTSLEAATFLDELRADKEVGNMVYSSADDLNEKWDIFERNGDNSAYTSLLIKLFLAALESQT
ncbi:hypothetical protein AOQ84DRAFT_272414, partial [Glonium stellatum]